MEHQNLFTVLPMSQRLSLSEGGTYTGSITVANPADATEDFHYIVQVAPYNVLGENYEVNLMTMTSHSRIAEWITIDEPSGVLKPNESRKINFTIKVPEGAPGGGQYAAIVISSDPEASKTDGVSISNVLELASIIYADVDGEIVHSGTVLENNIPSFVLSTPITLSALVENTGNIHEDAVFSIDVVNAITGEVIFPKTDEVNKFVEIIMPETTRYITREISNLPVLGVVKINQTIYYHDETFTVEKEIAICPVWFIFLVIFGLISITIFIIMRVKIHRQNKPLAI